MIKKIIIIVLGIIIISGGLYYYLTNNDEEITNNKSSATFETKSEIDSKFDGYESYDIKLSNEDVTITKKGVYNITGSLDGHNITVDTEDNVLLILNGVTITSDNPGIYVKSAKNTYIKLIGKNTITGSSNADLDASIYSKDDLILYGDGSLKIESGNDGISSKDDLTIYEGTYNITSTGEGIKGKDSVTINDGTFNIKSTETSIKTTNEDEKGDLTINGGTFNLQSSNDGIHAKGKLEINKGTFEIEAVEGLEATYIVINDGTINIKAPDDGINATSKSNANTYSVKIEINGGEINIDMGQGDTDAIDSNGDVYINGGTININAQSPFDYDGVGELNGGTLTVNGNKTNELQNQMMGGNDMNMEGAAPQNGEAPPQGNRQTPPSRR